MFGTIPVVKARVAVAQPKPQPIDTAKITADAAEAAKVAALAEIKPLVETATDTANNAATVANTAKQTANGAINIVTETTMTQAQKDVAQDQLVSLAGDGIVKMRNDIDATTATANKTAADLAAKTEADTATFQSYDDAITQLAANDANIDSTIASGVVEGYFAENV